MFERYLTNALTTHFGHVVEGLDADKIRLSAWNGELVLKDLSLRRDALNHWLTDCPVEIAYGRIGDLEIRIPWKLIRSQFTWRSSAQSSGQIAQAGTQCSVILTDVNILVVPRRRQAKHIHCGEDSEAKEFEDLSSEEVLHEIEKAVQAALDAELLQRVAVASPSRTPRWQWIQMRLAEIVSNLSVTVRNIHVRYEDPGTSMGFVWNVNSPSMARYRQSFAIGVILQQFSVQSAETSSQEERKAENGGSAQCNATSALRHKIAAAQNLAVYWDSDCRLVSEMNKPGSDEQSDSRYFERAFVLLASGALPSSFVSPLSGYSTFQPRHSFVLDPFSPSLRLKLKIKEERSSETGAKDQSSSVEATLPSCKLNVSRTLLEDVGYLRRCTAVWVQRRQGFLSDKALRILTQLRPKESPRVDPRSWWWYAKEAVVAFQSIGQDSRSFSISRRRSRGWLGLLHAMRRRKRYIELYRNFLQATSQHIRLENHQLLQTFEKELLISEIVAFRMAAFSAVRKETPDLISELVKSAGRLKSTSAEKVSYSDDTDYSSIEHRMRMFVEMAEVLDLEENLETAEGTSPLELTSVDAGEGRTGDILWTTSLKCSEISVQINDRNILHHGLSDRLVPVVKLSSAFLLEQFLFWDGSWQITTRIGSLTLEDCISRVVGTKVLREHLVFPYLVTPKEGRVDDTEERTFELDGTTHQEIVMVSVRRVLAFEGEHEIGSTTTTKVRVLPLEIVYSTKPVEALGRILSLANMEFADDYHRIASRFAAWRERQQQRLLRALAHKKKTILVDVDVGAPVLLLPEGHQDGMIVVVDLGKLRFANDDQVPLTSDHAEFDDKWRLEISSIQMLCCLGSTYRKIISRASAIPEASNDLREGTQRLIEPFSLSFSICTKFKSEESKGQNYVQVVATLPRLAFNLTSSAVRLLRGLQMQWQERKREIKPVNSFIRFASTEGSSPARSHSPSISGRGQHYRILEFKFCAPLLCIKLENDVDGRDCKNTGASTTTPLFDLSLRGMEGIIKSESGTDSSKLCFDAKVRTLTVSDLYQHAGSDFGLLVSSVAPTLLHSFPDQDHDPDLSSTDLVTFEYVSERSSSRDGKLDESHCPPDKLAVRFHELYLEWNPETIAAVHKAVGVSAKAEDNCGDKQNTVPQPDDEEFFDAEEDDFFDADSVISEDESQDSLLISEISSRVSSFSDLLSVPDADVIRWQTWHGLGTPFARALPAGIVPSPWLGGTMVQSPATPQQRRQILENYPFVFKFDMSKLRINFNKESRHRRLVTAEMDRTHVTYTKRSKGGFHTRAVIGNLSIADPSSAQSKTLYREILGLKTDTQGGNPSSLFEMEFTSNLRSRTFVSKEALPQSADEGVAVDLASGVIRGYDNKLEARLSPMRFVYLQQLTFEVVDYFFEGIVGYEVWGKRRPLPFDPVNLEQEASEPAVDNITFTLFNVVMDSPVLLFPVSQCSPDFVRLQAESITFGNRYKRRPIRRTGLNGRTRESLMQWYNNCDVAIEKMKISTSTSAELTDNALGGHVMLNWPTGTTASVNVPKWKVEGDFHSMSMNLRSEDFALLQHILRHNLGEESRNLEEWHLLQSLSPDSLDRYRKSIFVHFGYDQKDVTPATFDVTLRFPIVDIILERDGGRRIADARFVNLSWEYKKLTDLISRQKVTCDVDVSSLISGSEVCILSRSEAIDRSSEDSRMLTYTSVTNASGDNSRVIDIASPHIRMVIPAWKELSEFFQNLPDPVYIDPDEVIQIGDRYYRIGKASPKASQELHRNRFSWVPGDGALESRHGDEEWHQVPPSYEFNVLLRGPRVRLGDEHSALVLSLASVGFAHNGKAMKIKRKIDLKGIEAMLVSAAARGIPESPLLEPWSISASLQRCNGQRDCCCEFHSVKVSTGTIKARAAFSDLILAIDVILNLTNDIRKSNEQRSGRAASSESSTMRKAEEVELDQIPKADRFHFIAEGLSFTVVDDSGRHFAGSQDLMTATTDRFDYRTEKRQREPRNALDSEGFELYAQKSTHLRVQRVVIVDCLQATSSPFRRVLIVEPLVVPELRDPVNLDSNSQSDYNGSTTETERTHGLEFMSLVDESNASRTIIGSVEAQYNPCMIIALQRFSGRLLKRFNQRKSEIVMEGRDDRFGDIMGNRRAAEKMENYCGSLEFTKLSVCLNKEHQERRLVQAILTSCQLDIEKTGFASRFSGHVKTFDAFSSGQGRPGGARRDLAKSCDLENNFLSFEYRTFRKSRELHGDDTVCLPMWLQDCLKEDEQLQIDDYLEVSVGTMEARFLRAYTEELIDYLGTGMPGRGMGATSRAAKGFVAERIQRRSFLHVTVDAPRVLVPESDGSTNGIAFQLGDLRLLSWIEHPEGTLGSSRRVSTSLKGVECSILRLMGPEVKKKNVVERIDIAVNVEKTKSRISLGVRVSDVSVHLSYTDYKAILSVLRNNLTKRIDKQAWDNLEAKWESETPEPGGDVESQRYSADITYASSARYIRYGQTRALPSDRTPSTFYLRLSLTRLSLVLRRDDGSVSTGIQYDMLLAHGQDLEASIATNTDGDISMNLTLREIYIFDLGERGRALLDADINPTDPRIAVVMVEGYSPPEKKGLSDSGDSFDSQLVVKVDKESSGATQISVVFNYLSVTALQRSVQDILSFVMCEWDALHPGKPEAPIESSTGDFQQTDTVGKPDSSLRFRFVMHYPRFVFVADELDPHSRALVLRGLAIANASFQSGGSALTHENEQNGTPVNDALTAATRINADLQNISSHIIPDVSGILSPRVVHFPVLGDKFSRADLLVSLRNNEHGESGDLGVPLLLPVTLSIEMERTTHSSLLTRHFVSVNVDPLSVMLGSADLQLVQSVVSKWSSKSSNAALMAGRQRYDAVFQSERLGLGLRRDDGMDTIVVDNVKEPALAKGVQVGDVVYSINGVFVGTGSVMTLAGIVDQLATSDRPLRVTFERPRSEVGDDSDRHDRCHETAASVNVSFSSAILTLVEKDFPLIRGEVLTAKIKCGMSRGADSILQLSVSSSIAIYCYNLNVWGWEPVVEQGNITFSADYQDPQNDTRQLALELGDGQGGLALNITDAAAETVSKAIQWGSRHSSGDLDLYDADEDGFSDLLDKSENQEVKASVSRNAVNAALQYARSKQRGFAKPFVFKNRTGLSVAIAQHNRTFREDRDSSSASFLAVGEYIGLQSYDPSQIVVVGSGEEFKFRIDTMDDTSGEEVVSAKFPTLTVSLQTIGGIGVQPLENLQMHIPGETLIPLRCYRAGEQQSIDEKAHPEQQLAVWRIEHEDEQTVMTLGGSIRVLSLLPEPIGIGVQIEVYESEETEIRNIGTAYAKRPFFLPLWLVMQDESWSCSVKLDSEHRFSRLFSHIKGGSYDFGPRARRTIRCHPQKGETPFNWLAVSVTQRDGVFTIIVDSFLSLRNLLPAAVEWEVADHTLTPIDGSTLRQTDSFEEGRCYLGSGEKAEILALDDARTVGRFRPRGVSDWSQWVSLSLVRETDASASTNGKKEDATETDQELVSTRYAYARDAFGVVQTVGVRISEKECGFDVVLSAELWCMNCSHLDLTFGCPREQCQLEACTESAAAMPSDRTAAEATLKEMSSLFESGKDGKGLGQDSKRETHADVVRLPGQGTQITEEAFEYVDIKTTVPHQRWWATEDPFCRITDPTSVEEDGDWFWIDPSWHIDNSGRVSNDGWESSPNPNDFAVKRGFNPTHRFRRRRWFRKRSGPRAEYLVKGIDVFFQPRRQSRIREGNRPEQIDVHVAVKVGEGHWGLSSNIPRHGTVHGAIRASASRWPKMLPSLRNVGSKPEMSTGVYELCYMIKPLDGIWGEFSRVMLVSSRFLLRNVSKRFAFEVKQAGTSDSSLVLVKPGERVPFHWSDSRRPELICVRPVVGEEHHLPYRWSGGFDPLTIGAIPLRIRYAKGFDESQDQFPLIRSIKMEAEIRTKTGGTGINLSFEEEDPTGEGALFRVENRSTYPVWMLQDGILANPSWGVNDGAELEGIALRPSEKSCFGLDVPFRQGKYSGRKAATMAELLRLRLGLAPLTSRAGIETTKVLSLAKIGDRVRLNPSKLTFLDPETKSALDRVRVLGVVCNDGPTTVLVLRLMEKDTDNLLVNPFKDDSSVFSEHDMPNERSLAYQEIVLATAATVKTRLEVRLPTEKELTMRDDVTQVATIPQQTEAEKGAAKPEKDLQISVRISLRGLIVSLVDSAPSEIAVLTLKNVNAISSWNVQRTADATVFLTVTWLQVDNMIPNAPFPVAISAEAIESSKTAVSTESLATDSDDSSNSDSPPVLVIGLSFAPRHKTGIVCLKSVTVAPRNLALRVDLAFLVRLQEFALDLQGYFQERREVSDDNKWPVPDIGRRVDELEAAAVSGVGRQKFFFGGLTILPFNVRLSVAPARALTTQQAALEGPENAAIHQAVRKGDVRLNRSSAGLLGVKVGSRNTTALAVVRGVFRSIVVDALLRLDGASVNFAGVSLRNHVSTGGQLSTQLGAHYLMSLRQNVPALLGSLAALGNPIGLVRGLGDGVSDFVLEPVKGFQRSVQEMDASHLVDGVARGTLSLARHTVGGFAESFGMLAETVSKNMVVLTLDRRYAQKRDRGQMLRDLDDINVALGLGSGVQKLVVGFLEGVTGVVKAPIRGAEKKGLEGFAKGIGKGLLGLLVKPIIGFSDGVADVMIGVKGTVEGGSGSHGHLIQVRPRRAFYGREKVLRTYSMADAAASALMMRTRLAGEPYLSHLDMGDRVALLSVKRLLLLGSRGQELLILKYKHIESLEVRKFEQNNTGAAWSIVFLLNTPRSNGSDVEVISCKEEAQARALYTLIEQGMRSIGDDTN